MIAVDAASSEPSSVVTIDPVRILDTREGVGLDGNPVFAHSALGQPYVPQKLQVTGAVPTTEGVQTPVPIGATGVLLNVTVVNPTARGFLSVRPGDATGEPTTSSLNFKAGDRVPNAVQVGLPTSGEDAGKIDISYGASCPQDLTGDVIVPCLNLTNAVIDVVGYMIPGAGVPGPKGDKGDKGDVGPPGASPTPVVETTDVWDSPVPFIGTDPDPVVQAYSSLDFTAPGSGAVSVDWFANVSTLAHTGPNFVRCVPTLTGTIPPGFESGFALSGSVGNFSGEPTFAMMSAFTSFKVAEGETITVDLICYATAEVLGTFGGSISASGLKATFSPVSP